MLIVPAMCCVEWHLRLVRKGRAIEVATSESQTPESLLTIRMKEGRQCFNVGSTRGVQKETEREEVECILLQSLETVVMSSVMESRWSWCYVVGKLWRN